MTVESICMNGDAGKHLQNLVCCSATIPLMHCVSFTELLLCLGSYSASRSKSIVCIITGIFMSSFHPTLYLLPKIPFLILIHFLDFGSYCKISFYIFSSHETAFIKYRYILNSNYVLFISLRNSS